MLFPWNTGDLKKKNWVFFPLLFSLHKPWIDLSHDFHATIFWPSNRKSCLCIHFRWSFLPHISWGVLIIIIKEPQTCTDYIIFTVRWFLGRKTYLTVSWRDSYTLVGLTRVMHTCISMKKSISISMKYINDY